MQTIWEYSIPLLQGSLWTLALFLLSSVLVIIVGLLTCFARLSSKRPLRMMAIWYIEFIRGTPLLVQLFFVYYGLGQIGIVMTGFTAGVIGLTLNYGAYVAEVFRGGILSIDNGQYEAARSLGIPFWQRLKVIILPQALRNTFPTLSNYGLVLIKDTSLVAVISVEELLRAGQMLAASTFQALLVYSMVAVLYFLISSVVSALFRKIEKNLAVPGYWDGSAENNAFGSI